MFKKLIMLVAYATAQFVQKEIETQGTTLKSTYVPLQGLLVPSSLEELKAKLHKELFEMYISDTPEKWVTEEELKALSEDATFGLEEGEILTHSHFVSMMNMFLMTDHFLAMGVVGATLVGQKEYEAFEEGQEVALNAVANLETAVAKHIKEINSNWLRRASKIKV